MKIPFCYHKTSVVLLGLLFLLPLTAAADSWMTLRVIPDLREIRLGGEIEELRLICRVEEEGVRFEWKLERGPGQLDGELDSRKVSYRLPKTLAGKSNEIAIVRVTAVNEQGEALSEQATFTLLAGEAESLSEAPTPRPTETPEAGELLKQASGTMSSDVIEDYLQRADLLLMQSFYVEPEGKNAFALYKRILKEDPKNQHARRQLHRILQDYAEWGDDAFYRKKDAKALRYYQRYCQVAQYMIDELGIVELSKPFQKMRERLKELGGEGTPTPVPSPTPEPRPSATPEKEKGEEEVDLEELREMLRKE